MIAHDRIRLIGQVQKKHAIARAPARAIALFFLHHLAGAGGAGELSFHFGFVLTLIGDEF